MLIVVDGANVVGSTPDGWWHDRAGAAERLRDRLAAAGPEVVDGGAAGDRVVLVVEGKARAVSGIPGVRVVAAERSGDDAIVDLVRDADADEQVLVVTADRGLRERVTALGARVSGPRSLRFPR